MRNIKQKTEFISFYENKEFKNEIFIYFDIDELTKINFSNGFEYGDNLLNAFCKNLTLIFGFESVFRWDSDEFIAITRSSNYTKYLIQLKKLIKKESFDLKFKIIVKSTEINIEELFNSINLELLSKK